MPRQPLLATASVCALSLLLESGCAGDTASRAPQGHVLAVTPKRDHFRVAPSPLVGAPAPAFVAPSVDGNHEIALKPGDGKVTVVHFCATWCEPCKKTLPALETIYARYKSDGLEVIAVDEDDDRDSGVAALRAAAGATYPMAWDEEKRIAANWKPRLMPCTFIVDRQGIVRFAHLEYSDDMWVLIDMELVGLL